MTDVEPQHRRSRIAWGLRTEPTTTPAGTHDHGQRNGPLFIAFFCIVLLFLVNVGLIWFVLSRGETRDAREQQMREEIREGQCDLLDAFPAAPLSDNVRREFGCGPGRAIEDFPPEVQQDLAGRTAPAVPAPSSPTSVAPGERLPGGGVAPPTVDPDNIPPPTPQREPAPEPPAPAAPPPAPTEPPGLLDPLTDPLCAGLGVCL